MITIINVLMAMDYVREAERNLFNYHSITGYCWWENETINATLWEADKIGIVSRCSTTQVHWTQKGIDMINGAAA